ncbi:alpha/beta hydrolase family protein [Amphibacillus cookii]|uniref:S9 family peptidase n=1 Tax=Amphibacillus cookii TaxID=767787 RepID=UPI00195CFA75|nr:S9 family peptidase [Amphibacillus cookii]MBM7542212.1 dipeptidyl aminopeptidase/acylaminoacyl peptidase [Amphibacillus cookii]
MKRRKCLASDLMLYKQISDPIVSSNDQLVYVERSVAEESDQYVNRICTTGNKQLTKGNQDTAPAWSPDGSQLAFLRKSKEGKQLWLLALNTRQEDQLTTFPYGVTCFSWSPTGRYLAIVVRDYPLGDNDLKAGKAFEQLDYKNEGSGYVDGHIQDVYLYDLASETMTQLTSTINITGPLKWSPDEKELSFLVKIKRDVGDIDKITNHALYSLDLSSQAIRTRTDTTLSIAEYSYGANRETVWLLANDQADGSASQNQVFQLSSAHDTPVCITAAIDMQLGNFALGDTKVKGDCSTFIYQDSDQSIYLLGTKEGYVHVYQLNEHGEIRAITTGAKDVYHFAFSENDNLLYIAAVTDTSPSDLFVIDLSTGETTNVTNNHQSLQATRYQSETTPFWFESDNQYNIQGWLKKPKQQASHEKLPLILYIHGGPHAMYANVFNHELETIVGQGYAVMFINPRGSFGYGQSFAKGCRGQVGEGDYHDLMKGVDHVLAHFSGLDHNRLGIAGGSYGGLMTNWIIGHSKRFKAAVTQRCISNWLSFYGVSDIGIRYTRAMIGGDPWQDTQHLWDKSPIAYVNNIETPLLIIHGENDLRCPVEQADQLFSALKSQDKCTKLIRFPNANHGVLKNGKPCYRINLLEHVNDWFNKYIKGESET